MKAEIFKKTAQEITLGIN